jgi:SAM-dependent methyltransferase
MLDLVERQLAEAETVPPFRGFRYALEAVMSDPELARPVRLLDVGCGVGHYSELVDRWFGREVVYHGCDDSPEMVATAQAAWPGRSFTQDDVLRPRVDYDGFDVLLAGALVDVLDDWPVALRSLLTSRAPYVILHRQRLRARGTVVRRAPGYADAWTPRTVLGERDLAEAVDGARRDVVLRIPIEGDVHTLVLRRRNV